MKKRDFIKSTILGSAGLFASGSVLANSENRVANQKSVKHWVWENPNNKEDDETLKKKYSSFFESGIRGMFFESDSERHFRAAKKAGLEAHRWMWTMNRGEKELLENHPEWYAVSRNGDSCATKPPYVNYYRWLCPSKPDVQEYCCRFTR